MWKKTWILEDWYDTMLSNIKGSGKQQLGDNFNHVKLFCKILGK